MKTKLLGMILCLAMVLACVGSMAAFAEEADTGYTLDETTKTYTVSTADGLVAVSALINAGQLDYNITLSADIDMTGKKYDGLGTAKDKAYAATFDGAGHSITGLSYNNITTADFGLAKCAGESTFKNITFINPDITAKQYAACIAGQAFGNVTISNCHIQGGQITVNVNYAAGFVGRFEKPATQTTVENCTVDGLSLTGQQSLGFIIGGEAAESDFVFNLNNIVTKGIVFDTKTSSNTRAGIVGYSCDSNVNFTNCVSFNDYSNCKTDFGAMSGQTKRNNVTYTNCIGNTGFCGSYEEQNLKTNTVTNCAIFSELATDDTGTQALYNATISDKITEGGGPDTLTIDGTAVTLSVEAAVIPVITTETTRTRVATMYESAVEPFKSLATALVEKGIQPHTHVYDQQVATGAYLVTEATCTQKAVYYYSCTCGAMGTETFEYGELAEHTYPDAWAKSETEHWHVCTTCGVETKDLGEHTFTEWTVSREATERRAGEKVRTCTVCGYEETETIPKLEPETTEPTTTVAEESTSGGCNSTVTGGLGIMMGIIAISGGMVVRKKKEH